MECSTSRVEYNWQLQEFMLGEFVFDLNGLYAHLEWLSDQRDPRGVRYQLADALSLIILAKLGGEDEPRGIADWLKHRAEVLVKALKLPRSSMPHEVTISRILAGAVNSTELEKVLRHYFDGQAQMSQEVVIAIDGKTLRGTIPNGQSQGLHLLAAYLPGIVELPQSYQSESSVSILFQKGCTFGLPRQVEDRWEYVTLGYELYIWNLAWRKPTLVIHSPPASIFELFVC